MKRAADNVSAFCLKTARHYLIFFLYIISVGPRLSVGDLSSELRTLLPVSVSECQKRKPRAVPPRGVELSRARSISQ